MLVGAAMARILGISIREETESVLHCFAVCCKFQEGDPEVIQ
jgi:hypothetical protein